MANAVTLAQVEKHITSRVVTYLDGLVRAGLDDEVIESIMKQVKLRFEVIAPNATQKAKDDIYDLVIDELRKYPALTRFGFSFDKSDIFVRKGNPLVEQTATLASTF